MNSRKITLWLVGAGFLVGIAALNLVLVLIVTRLAS